MRWTIDVDDYDYPSDDNYDQVGDGADWAPRQVRRLRSRYSVLFALAFTAGAAAASSTLWNLIQVGADALWVHWPWSVGLAIGAVGAFLILAFIGRVDLITPSQLDLVVAVIGGSAIAVVFGLQFDTEVDPLGGVDRNVPGGIWAAAAWIGVFCISVSWFRLRAAQTTFDVFDWFYVIPVAGITSAACYYAIRASLLVDWPRAGSALAELELQTYWSPVALGLLTVAGFWLWMTRFSAQSVSQISTDIRPSEEHLDESSTAVSSTYSPRALTQQERLAIAATALVYGALLLYVFIYFLPGQLVDATGLTLDQQTRAIAAERRTALAVLAGIAGAVTLTYTHLRHQLDRDANATSRYAQAIEQLGSKQLSVRLGGIYALERLAGDSPTDASTIFEVLATHVRQTANSPKDPVQLDIVAALVVLARAKGLRGSLDLRRSDLLGGVFEGVTVPRSTNMKSANLVRTNWENSKLEYVRLDDADLSGANLREADISSASLAGATMVGADLYHCWGFEVGLMRSDLTGANLSNSRFYNADFASAILSGAVLEGGHFYESKFVGALMVGVRCRGTLFTGADFSDCDLTGSDLSNANLEDATFTGAILNGVSMAGATVSDGVDWSVALTDGATIFP